METSKPLRNAKEEKNFHQTSDLEPFLSYKDKPSKTDSTALHAKSWITIKHNTKFVHIYLKTSLGAIKASLLSMSEKP